MQRCRGAGEVQSVAENSNHLERKCSRVNAAREEVWQLRLSERACPSYVPCCNVPCPAEAVLAETGPELAAAEGSSSVQASKPNLNHVPRVPCLMYRGLTSMSAPWLA